MSTKDPGPAGLGALAAEVEDLSRRLKGVESVAAEAADQAAGAHKGIARVVELMEEAAARRSTDGGDDDAPLQVSPPWLVVDDLDTARMDLADLVGWLQAVYLRYDKVTLSDCWMWHPGVIAELTALRNAWSAAHYGDRASAAAVMDWHDRYRPGCVQRLDKVIGSCGLDRHDVGGEQEYRPVRVPGTDLSAEIAEWWTSTKGSTAAPAPTKAMHADARARLSQRRPW